MLFDYFFSYLYMHVLKLTLGNFYSAYFPLLFSFWCEASGRPCSCVQTRSALSISYLTVCRPDEFVPRPDVSFLLSLQNTHYFLPILSCRVVCDFSRTDPEILVFSAHLFSFPGISFDFPYSIKLQFFLEYWNL
jgi:hypothetical protein